MQVERLTCWRLRNRAANSVSKSAGGLMLSAVKLGRSWLASWRIQVVLGMSVVRCERSMLLLRSAGMSKR